MNTIKTLSLAVFIAISTSLYAQKDYKASLFGIRSDGETLNTTAIQKAIDYISEKGGGQLVFYVGRYVTGTVFLKSNVTIRLESGAGLVGSTMPYDYQIEDNPALVVAIGQQNTGITGKGYIEGRGTALNANIAEQGAKGNLPTGLKSFRPALLRFEDCRNISLSNILLFDAGGDVQIFTNCHDVNINAVTIKSKSATGTKGFVLNKCTGFQLANSFVDVSSEPLLMKDTVSESVEIKNSITAEGKSLSMNFDKTTKSEDKNSGNPENLNKITVQTKDYNVLDFGVKPDNKTVYTKTFQRAIDVIHERGGGRLVFPAGNYVSGSLHLKAGVTLHLDSGAVLLGSLNPLDYDMDGYTGFIMANRQDNIGITGGGLIDGRGREVANNIVSLVHRGIIEDPLILDRPHETLRPMIISFIACNNILIEDINIANAASWVQIYDRCKNLNVNKITVRSNAYWNNDGIDVVDCENVKITNSFFDAADDAICLKSHDANYKCKNVLIYNNVARSGASGIKFGTASRGGFADINVINNKVYDTFRSALTISVVDGGSVENVVVDTLTAMNTGNAIYLRVGARSGEKKSLMKNISLSNIYAEIPEEKPDKGYEYEGPVEDLPRNVSPSAIAGLPDNYITDVQLKNITIVYPGGGNPHYAKCDATPEGLAAIPEMERSYPEFSQFKELPAWGFFVRHAKNITFENVKVTAEKPDYRPAFVFDDAHGISLNRVTFIEPNAEKKQQLYHHRSTKVMVK